MEKDLEQGLPVRVVRGDRGYDDGNNHLFLWSRGIHSAVRLKGVRTKKKDRNKEVWQRLLSDAGVRGGAEGAVQGRAEVWGGEGAAWVEEVSVCRVDGVCDSGVSDGRGVEPEAVGELLAGGQGSEGARVMGCSRG